MKYNGPNGLQDYPPNFGEAATMMWIAIFALIKKVVLRAKAPSCPECHRNWGHEHWCSRR